jgi:enoyl-CoA hydratase
MSQDWPIDVVDGAAVVTMNSTKANTIDGHFVAQFGKMLDKLEKDPAFNKLPVVLTGHGAYFSAGFDLKAFAAGNIDAVGGLFGYMLRILSFPRPVVAAGA